MKNQRTDWRDYWLRHKAKVEQQLNQVGLPWLSGVGLQAIRPFTPLTVQVIWLVQPFASFIGRAEALDALVDLLEEDNPC